MKGWHVAAGLVVFAALLTALLLGYMGWFHANMYEIPPRVIEAECRCKCECGGTWNLEAEGANVTVIEPMCKPEEE